MRRWRTVARAAEHSAPTLSPAFASKRRSFRRMQRRLEHGARLFQILCNMQPVFRERLLDFAKGQLITVDA